MVRAHAYPALAAISSLSLMTIALLQIPGAVKDHRYNLCIDEQMTLRHASNFEGPPPRRASPEAGRPWPSWFCRP